MMMMMIFNSHTLSLFFFQTKTSFFSYFDYCFFKIGDIHIECIIT